MPIVNTAVLGAVAEFTGVVRVESLERAIAAHVPRAVQENRAACRDGAAGLLVRDGTTRRVPVRPAVHAPAAPLPDGPVAERSSEEIRTSSWRTLRPRIDRARCTRCNFCWKYCPDVALDLDPEGYPSLLEAHCKGCGICAEVCPPRAIEMVPEPRELAV